MMMTTRLVIVLQERQNQGHEEAHGASQLISAQHADVHQDLWLHCYTLQKLTQSPLGPTGACCFCDVV